MQVVAHGSGVCKRGVGDNKRVVETKEVLEKAFEEDL